MMLAMRTRTRRYRFQKIPFQERATKPKVQWDEEDGLDFADGRTPLHPLLSSVFFQGEVWIRAADLAEAIDLDFDPVWLWRAGLTPRSAILLLRCNEIGPTGPLEIWWGIGWWVAFVPWGRGWLRLGDEWCIADEQDALRILGRLVLGKGAPAAPSTAAEVRAWARRWALIASRSKSERRQRLLKEWPALALSRSRVKSRRPGPELLPRSPDLPRADDERVEGATGGDLGHDGLLDEHPVEPVDGG